MAKAQLEGQHEGAWASSHDKVDGEFRIISDPPLVVPLDELCRGAGIGSSPTNCAPGSTSGSARTAGRLQPDRRHLLETYRAGRLRPQGRGGRERRHPVLDRTAHGQGRRRSRCSSRSRRPRASVLEPYAGKSQYANHGQRVVEGQRLLAGVERHPPRLDARRRPRRRRARLLRPPALGLEGVGRPRDDDARDHEGLRGDVRMDARPRARPLRRPGRASPRYLGSSDAFDQAIADFATTYADQNQRDYEVVSASLRAS